MPGEVDVLPSQPLALCFGCARHFQTLLEAQWAEIVLVLTVAIPTEVMLAKLSPPGQGLLFVACAGGFDAGGAFEEYTVPAS